MGLRNVKWQKPKNTLHFLKPVECNYNMTHYYMGLYMSLCACVWTMGSLTPQQNIYKVKTPCWLLGHAYQLGTSWLQGTSISWVTRPGSGGSRGPEPGWVFYHRHGLELLVHSGNKKQVDFSLVLLLFLNSLQTTHSLTAYTRGRLLPVLGTPPQNIQLNKEENSVSYEIKNFILYSGVRWFQGCFGGLMISTRI